MIPGAECGINDFYLAKKRNGPNRFDCAKEGVHQIEKTPDAETVYRYSKISKLFERGKRILAIYIITQAKIKSAVLGVKFS